MMGLSPIDLIAVAAVFMLTLSVCGIGAVLWWQSKLKKTDRFKRRVGVRSSDEPGRGGRVVRLFRDGEEVEALLPGKGGKKESPLEGIAKTFRAAGLDVPPHSILLVALGIAVGVFAAAWVFTQHTIGAGVASAVAIFIGWNVVKMRAGKKLAKFDEQFVEALGLCARSLRAGHTVTSGMKLAADESDEPVRSLFNEICQQQELGVSLEDALRNAAAGNDSEDLKLFAASVAVQIRAGGNLADTTNRLAAVVRDRLRLSRRVKVLTAQTQMSRQVLVGLPVVVFGVLNAINPEYVQPMYDTSSGQMMLVIAVASLLVGMVAMNKMAVLKY